jgi:hypothetical protein
LVAALTSLGVGVLGWYPLVIAIDEGQSDTTDGHGTAIHLVIAGAASVMSVFLAVLGLARLRRPQLGFQSWRALGLLLGTCAPA